MVESNAQKCLATLEDLAQDINEFIKFDQELQKCIGKCVYLSETTPELANERNEIKRTLQQHGYRVMPEEELPFDNDAFEAKVKTYFERLQSFNPSGGLRFHHDPTGKSRRGSWTSTPNNETQLSECASSTSLALRRGEGDPRYSRLIGMPAGTSPRETGESGVSRLSPERSGGPGKR
jgi:hypothetical protein